METELLPCPFCGEEAKILVREGKSNHQIVGCSNASMLCPTPTTVVYNNEKGEFDYKWWNRRTPAQEK